MVLPPPPPEMRRCRGSPGFGRILSCLAQSPGREASPPRLSLSPEEQMPSHGAVVGSLPQFTVSLWTPPPPPPMCLSPCCVTAASPGGGAGCDWESPFENQTGFVRCGRRGASFAAALKQSCLGLSQRLPSVVRGHYKGQQIGQVVQVYRKKYVVYIERVQRERLPAPAVITRLKLDKDREKILERKAKSRQVGKEKGKYKEELIEKIQE
ncbi:60S ribosomal protein L26-like 1 [Myotis davidii]|uniref:60S ribosomal protein L26-like 1 n=1 Tax=Myotis davidii TaxID=225400 RepID=L5LS88_MYODS|nr:60S ribosomal protein L26-like 1 [Myotis davidii]